MGRAQLSLFISPASSPRPPPPFPFVGAPHLSPPPLQLRFLGRDSASVNVLSLGFAATAALLSLFLLVALFERFLRPPELPQPPSSSPSPAILPAPLPPSTKHYTAAPVSDGFIGVSVVIMPGHSIPTFIAKPLPLPYLIDEAVVTRPAPCMSSRKPARIPASKNSIGQDGILEPSIVHQSSTNSNTMDAIVRGYS